MAPAGGPKDEPPTTRVATYTDAEGLPTEDAAAAVRGDLRDYNAHGHLQRRTWFFLQEREMHRLPIGEHAFLVWVLVFLMLVWLGIGLVLILT